MTTTDSAASVLDKLRGAGDYAARLDALEEALNHPERRAFHDDPALKAAIISMGRDGPHATPQQRLRALLLVGDLGPLGKDIKKLAQAQVKPLLEVSPAPVSVVSNPKHQARLLGLVAAQKRDWVLDYLAQTCLSADLGDKPRLVAGTALFQRCASWEEGFRRLRASVTEPPSTGIASAALTAARAAISRSAAPPGVGFVRAVAEFLAPLLANGTPRDSHTAKLGFETVLLFDACSAKRPVILGSVETVDLLTTAKALAPKGKLSAMALAAWSSIAGRIADVIGILAREGVAAIEWFSLLERIAASREAALKHTKSLAAEVRVATPAVSTLLREGYVPAAAEPSLRESDDSTLATALLRATELLPLLESNAQYGDHAKALAVEVQGLARRRGLALDGGPSQVVDYSSFKHRIAGDIKSPPRKVKIIVPGVVRVSGEVVLQAIVEAVE
jgi:hypothetical protein